MDVPWISNTKRQDSYLLPAPISCLNGIYMQCINCSSDNVKNLGMRFMGKVKGLGFTCNDCGETFVIPKDDISEEDSMDMINDDVHYIRDDEYIESITSAKRIVFTSALNNTLVNEDFLNSLMTYCDYNKAKFVVFPIKYRNPSMIHKEDGAKTWYSSLIEEYLVDNNFEIRNKVRALGSLKIQATATNPLSGMDGLSKGYNLIIGHPQVALKTLPRNANPYPAIATTTGAITVKHYSTTKLGYTAAFNHSMSAVVIEFDDAGDYFVRHLNFDGRGFFDLDRYYYKNGSTALKEQIEAVITGDEHATFADPGVREATYGKKSITSVLKPKYVVRHDVLDFFSASHHNRHNVFMKYAKHHSGGMGSVYKEIMLTVNYIKETTPKNCMNVLIASNHNEHLLRWLNECDPKNDPENALLYHELMYKMLLETTMGETSVRHPEPFELFAKDILGSSTKFLSRNEAFTIGEVVVSNHGDRGVSGSRGSSKQFSTIPVKTVTGHSHSPVIDKGNYTVGTSSRFDLSYVSGLSSWHHAHCLIYPNGKRQMIFIVNGKWRA
jgi:hypothetical protein